MPDVSASAAEWYTGVFLACNVPTAVVSLPLGRCADARGRRPVLLWCLGTQLVGALGMLIVCLFELDLVPARRAPDTVREPRPAARGSFVVDSRGSVWPRD